MSPRRLCLTQWHLTTHFHRARATRWPESCLPEGQQDLAQLMALARLTALAQLMGPTPDWGSRSCILQIFLQTKNRGRLPQ
jgi:hypothetical protein